MNRETENNDAIKRSVNDRIWSFVRVEFATIRHRKWCNMLCACLELGMGSPCSPVYTVTDPNGMNECFSKKLLQCAVIFDMDESDHGSVDFHTRWPLPSEFAQFQGGNPLQYNNAIPQ